MTMPAFQPTTPKPRRRWLQFSLRTLLVLMLTHVLAVTNSLLAAAPEPAEPEYAFPVVVNGKWGCIDRAGKLVVEPRFDYIVACREGRLAFNIGGSKKEDEQGVIAHRGGRWGFLSWTGEIVVPAEYVSVGTYREGHAAVRTDHGYGFIDRSGKMAIRPRFLRARYFQEGLCPVQEANKRFGFIDKRGDMVIPAKYDEVGNFYGGLAPVKIQEKYGYINMLGEFVIRATFASASDFTADGLARVCVGRSAFSGKVGFIDRRGDWGIEPQFNFEDVGHFREGLARVLCEGGFGYMDTSGNIFIPGRYRQCFDFSEGLAGVDCGIGDTEFGVIDKTGKMVIEPRLGAVFLPFDGGLSQVQVSSREGDKIGYVDKAGTWVWPPTK